MGGDGYRRQRTTLELVACQPDRALQRIVVIAKIAHFDLNLLQIVAIE